MCGVEFFEWFGRIEEIINCLNDEVEIIEEQQDIEIQAIEEIKSDVSDIPEDKHYGKLFIESCLQINKEKINQLIQAVKQLDRKIKENI